MQEQVKHSQQETVDLALKRIAEPGVNGTLHPPVDEFTRRRAIDGAMQRLQRRQSADKRRQQWLPAITAAVVLAIVVSLVYRLSGTDNTSATVAPSSAGQAGPISLNHIPHSGFALLHGEVYFNDKGARLGDRVPINNWIETGRGQTAFSLPTGIAVGLSSHSAARVFWNGRRNFGVELNQGMGLFSIAPDTDREGFYVKTPKGTVHVTGTLFTVRITDSGDVAIHLHKGRVKVEGQNGATLLLEAGGMAMLKTEGPETTADISDKDVQLHMQKMSCIDGGQIFSELSDELCGRMDEVHTSTVTSGPEPAGTAAPFRRNPTPGHADPASLLQSARSASASGNYEEAAKSLEELIRRYPKTDDARTALVSLAQMELRHLGRAESSVRHFSAYLKRPGPLTQEALFGKAKGQRILGQKSQEQDTLKQLVDEYPNGPAAGAARKRLDELSRSPWNPPK